MNERVRRRLDRRALRARRTGPPADGFRVTRASATPTGANRVSATTTACATRVRVCSGRLAVAASPKDVPGSAASQAREVLGQSLWPPPPAGRPSPAAERARPRPSNSVSTRPAQLVAGTASTRAGRPSARGPGARCRPAWSWRRSRPAQPERTGSGGSPPRPRRAAAPTAGAGRGARPSAAAATANAGQGGRARPGPATPDRRLQRAAARRPGTRAPGALPSPAPSALAGFGSKLATTRRAIESGTAAHGRPPDARAEHGRGQQGYQDGAADERDARPPSRRRARDRWSGPRASGTRTASAMRRIPGAGRAIHRGSAGGPPDEGQARPATSATRASRAPCTAVNPTMAAAAMAATSACSAAASRRAAERAAQARRASCARGEGRAGRDPPVDVVGRHLRDLAELGSDVRPTGAWWRPRGRRSRAPPCPAPSPRAGTARAARPSPEGRRPRS